MISKVVLYKGRRGAGKTLTMVKDGYKYHLNGIRVLRNFECFFGELISEEEILKLNKDSKLKNCVIMLDELQIFFDSRQSMRKQNITFSNFIQQIRKRNITLLGTTQFSNTIDLRFRQHTDILVYPHLIRNITPNKDVCEAIYMDLTTIEDDPLGDFSEPLTAKIVYNPHKIYKLYNTEEMIK